MWPGTNVAGGTHFLKTDNMATERETVKSTMAQINGHRGKITIENGEDNTDSKTKKTVKKFDKNLTVCVELQGEGKVTTPELKKAVRELCGGLLACRMTGEKKYELTMMNEKGKERLLEGMKIGEVTAMARELNNGELVVSFLNLPAYIEDEDILNKLKSWGVSASSPIKRRMWPGTNVADGTRFLKDCKTNSQGWQRAPFHT
ncbi:uncharacterized protein LOC122872061 isoform X2 [Siniperca chuatsi]|uniref:uncharacterized protein LOC122872061 isoform X2 n=1 Tax=Siniperca chuatsi TaxID=119488 RepID=UPI001CE12713|nr:uncharacterized protein LOC122872061 isoform X2 [Siniperca chuatsi]